MPTTIHVTPEEVEEGMPDWVKRDTQAVHDLYHNSLEWRSRMHGADASTQDMIRDYAREWDTARHTITLAEAERRWGKTNLRQNDPMKPFRWKADDSRGTWLTTTYAMEAAFGPEPAQMAVKSGGNWRLYWGTMPLPDGAEAIGTIIRSTGKGALIRLSNGNYVQGNAGGIRTLDSREVEKMLDVGESHD